MLVIIILLRFVEATIRESTDWTIQYESPENSIKHPYTVAVRPRTKGKSVSYLNRHFWCCGCLIHETAVLTAAHCMIEYNDTTWDKPGSLSILAGTNNLFPSDEDVIIGISKNVYVYEDFKVFPDGDLWHNDIAVIVLRKPLPLDNVRIAAIPLANKIFPVGTKCTAQGWKYRNVDPEIKSDFGIIQTMDMIIMKKSDCQRKYTHMFNVDEKQLCAGQQGRTYAECFEDSGGPLVCNGFLVGILCGGFNCDDMHYPAIYTDVFHYRNFAYHLKSDKNCGLLKLAKLPSSIELIFLVYNLKKVLNLLI